ncbi:hypothetical protein [Streptomyces sp. x-80]|uniref:hypothetical protein n=1 Tax=Streptomyces sp. x-80 TaxID=2789282 RepID=UPI003980A194
MSEPIQVVPASAALSGAFFADIGIHGLFTLSFSIPSVTNANVVMVSMTELGGSSNLPFIGDATMTVHNVAPGNGIVQVRGEVDWDSNLSTRVYFLVT